MKASIKQLWQKIKGFVFEMREEITVSFIIILVGFCAFGLGRLSVNSEIDGEIKISQSTSAAEAMKPSNTGPEVSAEAGQSGSVVASKSGKKYHYPWCGGAKQIAEKNKITFATIEEARKAGYLPAANCKGLK